MIEECLEPCRSCGSTSHTVDQCCARAWSYAARVKGDRPVVAQVPVDGDGEEIEVDVEELESHPSSDVPDDNMASDGEQNPPAVQEPPVRPTVTDDAPVELGSADDSQLVACAEQASACLSALADTCVTAPAVERDTGAAGEPSAKLVRVDVHSVRSPEPVKVKRVKTRDTSPSARQVLLSTESTDDADMDSIEEYMTPTPSQELSTAMLDFRKRQASVARGRARSARN